MMALLAAVLMGGGCTAHHSMVRNGKVEMYLTAPQAQSVVLVIAGDPFQKVPASRDDAGAWKVTLNHAGEFKYFYLVDNKAYVPDCRMREQDDFGSDNCVFTARMNEVHSP
jgi:hypothetical protein